MSKCCGWYSTPSLENMRPKKVTLLQKRWDVFACIFRPTFLQTKEVLGWFCEIGLAVSKIQKQAIHWNIFSTRSLTFYRWTAQKLFPQPITPWINRFDEKTPHGSKWTSSLDMIMTTVLSNIRVEGRLSENKNSLWRPGVETTGESLQIELVLSYT